MRWLKPVLGTMALVLFVRYSTVYYRTHELRQFIHQEVTKATSKAMLHERIMKNAAGHKLALAEEDIAITQEGDLLSVELNYRVPVNFYFAKHVLAFHAAASGSPQKFTW
jgi:hypothetical protein